VVYTATKLIEKAALGLGLLAVVLVSLIYWDIYQGRGLGDPPTSNFLPQRPAVEASKLDGFSESASARQAPPKEGVSVASGAALAPPNNIVIERGPRGGVLNVPEGYFICERTDPLTGKCTHKAKTEQELAEEEAARNNRLATNTQTVADEFIDCMYRSPLGHPPSPGVTVEVSQVLADCVDRVSEPTREQYSTDPAVMAAVRRIKREQATLLASAIYLGL
jgi:hypothetical protein